MSSNCQELIKVPNISDFWSVIHLNLYRLNFALYVRTNNKMTIILKQKIIETKKKIIFTQFIRIRGIKIITIIRRLSTSVSNAWSTRALILSAINTTYTQHAPIWYINKNVLIMCLKVAKNWFLLVFFGNNFTFIVNWTLHRIWSEFS